MQQGGQQQQQQQQEDDQGGGSDPESRRSSAADTTKSSSSKRRSTLEAEEKERLLKQEELIDADKLNRESVAVTSPVVEDAEKRMVAEKMGERQRSDSACAESVTDFSVLTIDIHAGGGIDPSETILL